MSASVAEPAPTVLVDTQMRARRDAALVAREMVASAAEGIAPATLDDILLVVSELVTNAVRHGPARGPIHLDVRRNEHVRIEVQDRGEGFEPPLLARAEANLPTGGFGLSIVGHLSTNWGITLRDGTTLVWAEVPLRGDA